jgi:hypothetical protein
MVAAYAAQDNYWQRQKLFELDQVYTWIKHLPGIGPYWAEDLTTAIFCFGLARGYTPGSLLDSQLDILQLILADSIPPGGQPPSSTAIRTLREAWLGSLSAPLDEQHQLSWHQWMRTHHPLLSSPAAVVVSK